MPEVTVYGVCWYKPEQWQRLREIVDDPDDIEDTHEEWKKGANKAISEFQSQGIQVKKVSINVEELLAWCNERGVPVNGESRSEYVTDILRQRSNK